MSVCPSICPSIYTEKKWCFGTTLKNTLICYSQISLVLISFSKIIFMDWFNPNIEGLSVCLSLFTRRVVWNVDFQNWNLSCAGHGAVLNIDGEVELDSIIMDGETLATGAVASVRNIANPVSLARAVMEKVYFSSQIASELIFWV